MNSTWRASSRSQNASCRELLRNALEREAEHDLRHSHEPGLCGDLTERGGASGHHNAARLHSVEQVEHFDLHLGLLAPLSPKYFPNDTSVFMTRGVRTSVWRRGALPNVLVAAVV